MLCVRWYLSFKLSYRDLVAIMGERAIFLAHSTILRWVQHPGVRETMEQGMAIRDLGLFSGYRVSHQPSTSAVVPAG